MSEMRKDTIDPIYAHKMSDFRQWLDELLNGYRDTAWKDGYRQCEIDNGLIEENPIMWNSDVMEK